MTTQIQTQQPSIRNPYTKNNAPIPGQQEKTAQKSHFTTSTSAQTSATLKAIKQLRSNFDMAMIMWPSLTLYHNRLIDV